MFTKFCTASERMSNVIVTFQNCLNQQNACHFFLIQMHRRFGWMDFHETLHRLGGVVDTHFWRLSIMCNKNSSNIVTQYKSLVDAGGKWPKNGQFQTRFQPAPVWQAKFFLFFWCFHRKHCPKSSSTFRNILWRKYF